MVGSTVSRHESCSKCGADLRACLNCRHYDVTARSECREDVREPVRDKTKANFCDFFQPRLGAHGGSGAPSKDDLMKSAEALFKKK